MAQKYASFVVQVEARNELYESEASLRKRCERIVEQIWRHVDDVIDARVVGDGLICEFCGHQWTEQNPRYNGGCCKQDDAQATAQDRLAVYGPEGA